MKTITVAMFVMFAACLCGCLVFSDDDPSKESGALVTASSKETTDDDTAVDDDTETADDDAQGECAPTAPALWPEPDIDDPSVIAFDENLFFTVDGTRFFPLGFYSAPTDADGLAAFKSEGFNIALTGPGCCDGASRQDQIDLLTRARDAGVFMILHPFTPADQVLTRAEEDLAADLDARNDVGSLFGWYTFDEPGLNVPSKELTGRMHEILATYDPTHLDALVDAPMSDYAAYVDDCAIFMVDPYPSDWMPLVYVKATMQDAEIATGLTKPIIGVMQAFSWAWYDGNTDQEFHPDGREMRNMAWQFIIQGARGLIPFTYAGSYSIRYQEEIWASYLETIREMNELMRVILTDEAEVDLDPQCPFPTMFDYSVKLDGTTTWVFSVSTNERSMKVELKTNEVGSAACVVDYSTGEVFSPDGNGVLTVSYNPMQVRILEFPGE